MTAGIIRKAQPTVSQVHTAAPLTNIAIAYMQSNDNFIADKVFPIVPVEFMSDIYYKWNKDDFFRDEAQKRADGQESAGSGMNLTSDSYKAAVWGLHKDIGDQTRRNADPAIDIEVSTTRALMGKMLISRDRQFASHYMKTGVWGTDITGVSAAPSGGQVFQWSDATNSDPFSDISDGQTAILQNTGMLPNVLTVSWPVYQALRKHPLVIDRVKYTMQADSKNITPELLAAAFDVERVVVAKSVYNSANEGATGVYSFTVGKSAMLCYSNPEPGLMEASAGYIFGWAGYDQGGNGVGVSSWTEAVPNRGKPGSTIRCETELSYDMKVVGADLGYFWTSIVA